jgi:hypothetical protein
MNEAYEAIVDLVFPFHPHMSKTPRLYGDDRRAREYYFFLAMYKGDIVREFHISRDIASIREHKQGDRKALLLTLTSEGDVSDDYEAFLKRKSADSARVIKKVDMLGWSLTPPPCVPPEPEPKPKPEPEPEPKKKRGLFRKST